MSGKVRAASSAAPHRSRIVARHDKSTKWHVAAELAAARSLLGVAVGSCQGMLRFMADVQGVQSRVLHGMDEAVCHSLQEPQAAGELRKLVSLQAQLSCANLASVIASGNHLITRLLEVEAGRLYQTRTASRESALEAAHCSPGKSSHLLH